MSDIPEGYWRWLLVFCLFVPIVGWPVILLTCPHHLYRLMDWLFSLWGGRR